MHSSKQQKQCLWQKGKSYKDLDASKKEKYQTNELVWCTTTNKRRS